MEKFNADSSKFGGYSPVMDLPLEIVSLILSFLNYPTLQTARLVCKSWYNASLDPRLIQKEQFVLGQELASEDEELIDSYIDKLQNVISIKRNFNLKIKGHKYFIRTLTEFWKSIGDQVKDLSLQECEAPEDKLINDLKHCPRLKCLTLDRCCNDFRAGDPEIQENLLGLETLKIVCARGTDFKFKSLLDHAPNLKSVDLHVVLLSRIHSSKVTLSYLLDYFQRNPQVTLDLLLMVMVSRRRGDFEEKLLQLILLPNVRLRQFHTNYLPKSICQSHQPSLHDLLVYVTTGEDKLTSNVLESVCSNFPNLRNLALRDCEFAPGVTLRLPLTLTRLHLDFNSSGVTEEQLLMGLCSERNTILTRAHFILPNNITTTFFIRFAKSHPSVTFLRLVNCNFNDRGLQAILEHQVLLQKLFIDYNEQISDAGLMGETADGSSGSENLTRYAISRLKDLQKLGLEHCPNITGSVFKEVTLPRIKTVSLAYSKVPLAALVNLVERNPTIEELRVQRLDITDEFVYYAVEKLPHLKSLHITHCINISSRAKAFLSAKSISQKVSWDT